MKEIITYDDFAKLDIRVGLIVAADLPEWSNKLIRYEVDLGEEIGKRIIFSGIREWYKPEDLIGRKYQIIVNLAPKKMGQEESQGMMIMCDGKDKPVLIEVSPEVEPGTVVR